jgi:hypothetical protein
MQRWLIFLTVLIILLAHFPFAWVVPLDVLKEDGVAGF